MKKNFILTFTILLFFYLFNCSLPNTSKKSSSNDSDKIKKMGNSLSENNSYLNTLSISIEPSSIMGIHFWNTNAKNIMNDKTGWTVEVVNTDDGNDGECGINHAKNVISGIRSEGSFEPIVRINKRYGGTIPGYTSDYPAFAQACNNVVNQLTQSPYNVKYFVIGNEPNLAGENELGNGQGNAAADYAQCFIQCYNTIKSSFPSVIVLTASPGNWALTAPITRGGGNVYYDVYWQSVVNTVNNTSDGYAIHTYAKHTEGVDSHLQAQYRYPNTWGFDSYKVLMQILKENSYAVNKMVFITETNTYHGNTDPQGSDAPAYSYIAGWLQESYNKITAWNNTAGNQKIKSLCWFVYKDYGGWDKFSLEQQIGNMAQARADFSAITYSPPPPSGNIYHWLGGTNWNAPTGGTAVKISVDNNGYLWVVNSSGMLWKWNGSSWGDPIRTGDTQDIGCGADGSIVITTNDRNTSGGQILKLINGQWVEFSSIGRAKRVDVDSYGNVWVVNGAGDLYRWNGSWTPLITGNAQDVGCGPNGIVIATLKNDSNDGGKIMKYLGGTSWQEVGGRAVNVDVANDGSIWVINKVGLVWQYSNGNWFNAKPSGGNDIGCRPNQSSVWITVK